MICHTTKRPEFECDAGGAIGADRSYPKSR
jgi:hypothetical protein